jgi:hypothetical protein
MIELESPPVADHAGGRLAQLETRVAELEAALAALLRERDLMPPPADFAKTVRMAVLAEMDRAPAWSANPLDNLGITAAFAVLDSRVAEAAEHEATLARRPDRPPPVAIQPNLVVDRFSLDPAPARPQVEAAPRTPRVRCALEDYHPSILKQVSDTWPSAECRDYLQRLIVGDLARLEPGAMGELELLRDMLGKPGAAGSDPWGKEAR